MLRSLCEDYPSLTDDIQIMAATKYRLTLGDLPSPEQKNPPSPFASKLCRDLYAFNLGTAIATHEVDEDGWDGTLSLYDETGMRQSEGADPPIYERFLVRRCRITAGCRGLSVSRGTLDRRRSHKLSVATNQIHDAGGRHGLAVESAGPINRLFHPVCPLSVLHSPSTYRLIGGGRRVACWKVDSESLWQEAPHDCDFYESRCR